MKYYIILLFMLVFVISCDNTGSLYDYNSRDVIVGSHNPITVQKDFSDFNKIEVSHGFILNIQSSGEYSLEFRMDDNIAEYLVIYQVGDKIIIGLDDDYNYENVTLEVDITLPDLESLSLSGGCYTTMGGFSFSHSLDFNLSGGSVIVGDIETGNLYADLSGGSQMNLIGRGIDLELYESGGSRSSLKDFSINNAHVNLSGASNATITSYGELAANLSGASILYYYGDPELGIIKASGGSSIIKL